jgi:hypothetical protein
MCTHLGMCERHVDLMVNRATVLVVGWSSAAAPYVAHPI